MPASNENGPVVSPATDDTPAHTARVSRCSVILVHGTWGRGIFPKVSDLRRRYFRGTKRWFEDGSQFYVEMDAALESASLDWPIRAFLWSGTNSVHARDRAARDLSKQLREGLKDADATAVIIAHSHGGNVALRALQHLDSKTERIRVVTMATPFLRVFARRSFELSFSVKLFMTVALTLLVGFSFLFLFASLLPIVSNGDLEVQIILVLAGGTGYFIMKWLNGVFANPHTALAIEEAAHYDTKGAAASRMLVIRAVDDEASLSLAVGSIGSRLSFATLVAVIPAISSLVMFFVLVSRFIGLGVETKYSLWTGALMMGVYFGTLILFFIPGAFRSFFFGREFFVNAMTCDVAVDSVPDTLGQVEAITLRPVEADSSKSRFLGASVGSPWTSISSSEFGRIDFQVSQSSMDFDSKPSWQLRHGIYNHPDCVDEIVRWLRRVT